MIKNNLLTSVCLAFGAVLTVFGGLVLAGKDAKLGNAT